MPCQIGNIQTLNPYFHRPLNEHLQIYCISFDCISNVYKICINIGIKGVCPLNVIKSF